MLASPAAMDAFSTLGIPPSECDDCEASGFVTYHFGPYERTRECDDCQGTGRRPPCPHCTDGTHPGTGQTCPTCEGYAALF